MNSNEEDLDIIKDEIYEKISFLKDHSDDEEYNERIDRFSEYIREKSFNDDTTQNVKKLNKINRGLSIYQKFLMAFKSDVNIDPGRLLGLTDGIFGMVMTLLIFSIAIPEVEITSYSSFITFLGNLTPTIGITVVSFILISYFWIYHHEFIRIRTLNLPYLWINVLFLICISFIPFTTSLIGSYSQFFISEVIFGVNIFLTLVSFTLMYYYAYSRKFLENKPSKNERRYTLETLGITMILTMIINLLDYLVSPSFIYLFLLIPLISTFRDVYYKVYS